MECFRSKAESEQIMNTPKHTFRLSRNTDTVDIDAKCIGISADIGKVSDLNNNRGLKVQIRHNKDQATYDAANQLASLLVAAPDLLAALIDAFDLIEYARSKDAYTMRGGDHYIQTSNVEDTLCKVLGLDCTKTSRAELKAALNKAKGGV